MYISEISERLGIDESAILEKVREGSEKKSGGKSYSSSSGFNNNKQSGKEAAQIFRVKKGNRVERHLIAMMLQFPDILPTIKNLDVLEYFEDNTLKKIGELVLEVIGNSGRQVSELISFTDNIEQKKIIASLVIKNEAWDVNARMKFLDNFVEAMAKNRENPLSRKIRTAEESNDEQLLLKSLKEGNLRLKLLKEKQIHQRRKGWNTL